jgi:L-cysteine desulfidase
VKARIRAGHTRVDLLQVNGNNIAFDDMGNVQTKSVEAFGDELFDAENWSTVIDELYEDSELQQTVRQGIAYNMAAALHGKKYVEAVNTGLENLVMGAIYARMNGDPIPVMSCAGSGNKGLTCMVPVVAKARESTMGEEKEIRAVLMSVLLTNLITSRFGEVSSVCGAQYAAGAGVIGGILYLKERLDLFDGSYNNFVSAIGGGFCDGAKGSCSMRGNVAVSAAFNAITHAQAGFTVSGRDGFLGNNFRETLEHLSRYNPLVAKFEMETIKILQDK